MIHVSEMKKRRRSGQGVPLAFQKNFRDLKVGIVIQGKYMLFDTNGRAIYKDEMVHPITGLITKGPTTEASHRRLKSLQQYVDSLQEIPPNALRALEIGEERIKAIAAKRASDSRYSIDSTDSESSDDDDDNDDNDNDDNDNDDNDDDDDDDDDNDDDDNESSEDEDEEAPPKKKTRQTVEPASRSAPTTPVSNWNSKKIAEKRKQASKIAAIEAAKKTAAAAPASTKKKAAPVKKVAVAKKIKVTLRRSTRNR